MKKIIIIAVVLLVAALTALEVYVQSHYFAAHIRSAVVGPLQDVLGPDAQIGFVRANLIPPYLEVRDISLPDARGRTAIAIHKVTVYINPLPLIFKKIRLPYISVLDPRITAERGRDGTINLSAVVEKIRSNISRSSSWTSPGLSLMLRTIAIKNASIEFKDEPSATKASVQGLDLTARTNLEADRIRVSLRSQELRLAAPAYPEVVAVLRAAFEYDKGSLRFDSLTLRSGDADVSLSGTIGPLPDPTLDVKGKLRSGPQTIGIVTDLLKPAAKRKGARVEASVSITGKASAPQIDGNCSFQDVTLREVTLRQAGLSFHYRDQGLALQGKNWSLEKNGKFFQINEVTSFLRYERGGLEVRPLEIMADDLVIRVEGRADGLTGYNLALSATSSGAGQAFSFFTGLGVEGNVGLRGNVSGPLSAPVFEGNVAAGPVTIRKIVFSDIRGDVVYRDKTIKLSSVHIHQQSSRFIFEGTVDLHDKVPVYTARLQVLQSNVVSVVALFYQPIPLTMTAKGVLTFVGSGSAYAGSGYLTFDAGSAYGESFKRGTITATLSTGRITFPQVTISKDKGVLKGTGWIGFDGTYSADLEVRDMDLAAVDHLSALALAGESTMTIHSSGSFSAPTVKASLDVAGLGFRQAKLGSFRATADIKDGQMHMSASLLDGRTRLSARWALRKPYTWSADAKLDIDGLDPYLLLGKTADTSKMRILAKGSIACSGSGLDISALSGDAVLHAVSMMIGDYRVDNESDIVLSLAKGRLAVQSLRFSGPGTKISVTGSTHLLSDVDLRFDGRADLSLLKLLYREVEHAAGSAEVRLTIRDQWTNPDIVGELLVQNGEVKIKDIPQKFAALNGKITFTQGRIGTESLTGELGGGTMSVSGWAQLSGFALRDFSVKATVGTVTVRYPEGLTSTLSGNLYYDGTSETQQLTGDVTIKHARYDKRIEWKSMMVDIGKGLYQKKKTDIAWIGETQINVRFHGAESIVFQNNFANMLLDVDVFLRGTVNHPQLLGRVEARKGTVYFRKNEFKILSASADFTDPNRVNPVLDIQAETQVREYLIRLAITGTAERATVTLLSDPPLIDTDILSMLALGKLGSELKGKETGVGFSEAASFATGRFQDVFEQNARGLTGLDRFQIDPYVNKSDNSVPRVTVGKELVQNKLYVTYSSNVGATTPEQIFRIEYLLDRHFSLVGERNDLGNTGADIKYRVEFH